MAKKRKSKSSSKSNSTGDQQKSEKVTSSKPKRPKLVEGKKRVKDPNHVHESQTRNKALNYLDRFTADRDNWKFEKCRQIWLIQNAFEEKHIPDEKFDDLLKYCASIKGNMRKMIEKNASDIIEFSSKWQEMDKEGKSEPEIILELKKPKLSEKVVERAKEMAEMLND